MKIRTRHGRSYGEARATTENRLEESAKLKPDAKTIQHLRLVDAIHREPSEKAAKENGPNTVALERVRTDVVKLDPSTLLGDTPSAPETTFLTETRREDSWVM